MKIEEITKNAIRCSGILQGTLVDLRTDLKPTDHTRVTLVIDVPHQPDLPGVNND